MSQERELDSSLNDRELSRLYAESTRIEPPPHLDAAILAEAHRAVQARPEGKRQRRWAVPLGLVASLFVMVMVGLQLPYMLRETPSLQAPVPAAMAPKMDESSMAENAPAKEMRSKIAADQAATGSNNAPAAPPAEVAQPATAMAPAPAARAMEMRKREESARMDTLESEKKSAYSEGNIAPAMKPQAPAAAAAAPAPVLLERAVMKDESAAQRPAEWLKRIEKLKQEGKQEEVKKELEAFRKRYPDYPIPAGLKEH